MPRRPLPLPALALAAALLLAACSPADEEDTTADAGATASADASGGAACTPEDLETLTPGTLTLATSEPAFEPWVVDDDPTSGQGFESAVAYAVAEELGYAQEDVTWVRVPFEAAIAPGEKDFDAALNQFSITDERREAVDFSSGYYDVRQAVITVEGSPAADAASLADLQGLRIGAQVGTTSLEAVTSSVQPTRDPGVFGSNSEAVQALQNGQVDALAVDLPTAFYLTAVELDGGRIVGQLPAEGGEPEQFGMVLDLGSPLTPCVTQAVDALREDGTLAELEAEWLADVAGAPELS